MSYKISVTPTLDTSAYASGDVFVATTAIPGSARGGGQPSTLVGITLLDKADQSAFACNVLFYRSNVSVGTINAAPSISDANNENFEGLIPINAGDWVDVGGSKIVNKTATDVGMPLGVRGDSTNKCYFAIIAVGTPGTYSADSLIVTFEFE